ncbi:MAG: hypothetical protein HY287_05645 [Planctomycetes bacterium]|nr:hypothetical protein [Planctomycetota bacterium]MBI3833795.1 hypothetical protein [Planctomycetota bacterium]
MRKANVGVITGMVGVIAVTSALAGPRTDRGEKGNALDIRQVSDTEVAGYQKMAYGSGSMFVAPQSLLTGGDVSSVDAQPGRGSSSLLLGVSDKSAASLASMTGKSGVTVGIVLNGRLNTVGTLGNVNTQNGSASAIISGLTSVQAERVSKLVSTGLEPVAKGAVINVVPVGMSNGTYFVDVFVDGAKGLRSYQVTLDVTGGTSGQLSRTDLTIDQKRTDFVFGTDKTIIADDKAGGRAGAVLFDGSVDVDKNGYLGTYAFQPTADAKGSFSINVRVGTETILGDPRNKDMEYSAGPDAIITIGQAPNPRSGK